MDDGEAEASAGGDAAFDALVLQTGSLELVEVEPATGAAADAEEAAPGAGEAEDALDGGSDDGDDGDDGSEAGEEAEGGASGGAAPPASTADRSATVQAARATVRTAGPAQRARFC